MQIWFNQTWGWGAIKAIVSLSLWLSDCMSILVLPWPPTVPACTWLYPHRDRSGRKQMKELDFLFYTLLRWRFLEKSKSSCKSLDDGFLEESQQRMRRKGQRPCLPFAFTCCKSLTASWLPGAPTGEYCHLSGSQEAKGSTKSSPAAHSSLPSSATGGPAFPYALLKDCNTIAGI